MIRTKPDSYGFCPCGSGKKYKFCCRKIPRSGPLLREELARLLFDPSRLPVVSSWLTASYKEPMGLVMAVVVRSIPEGGFLVASALVDRLFLGVKDCHWERAASPADVRCRLVDFEMMPFIKPWIEGKGAHASFGPTGELLLTDEERAEIEEKSDVDADIDMTPVEVTYEEVRSFVLGAVAYAREFGQSPHPDWEAVAPAFEPDRPFEPTFSYGLNGKPLYIQGPNDDVNLIMGNLRTSKPGSEIPFVRQLPSLSE